jgi:hypothetical protein
MAEKKQKLGVLRQISRAGTPRPVSWLAVASGFAIGAILLVVWHPKLT